MCFYSFFIPGCLQTVVVKDMLYVCGGWNSVQQFNDLFFLDTKTWTWSRAECGSGERWGPPRYRFPISPTTPDLFIALLHITALPSSDISILIICICSFFVKGYGNPTYFPDT